MVQLILHVHDNHIIGALNMLNHFYDIHILYAHHVI